MTSFARWLSLFMLVAAPLAAQNFELTLDEGIKLYWNGEYEQTIGILQGACGVDATPGETADCFKYVAFSHVALGDDGRAEVQFMELLTEDPAYRLDPKLVSPKIIRRFDASRRRLADRLYADGKDAYYRKEFKTAYELMEKILRLEPEDELAREYRELSGERLRIDEARAAEPEAPEPEERIYRVTGDVTRPELLRRVEPEYPRFARMQRQEGIVVLRVVIDEEGRVGEPTVIRSVSKTIDSAAIEAVSQWRYRPAYLNGHPVPVHGVVRVSFQLH